MARKIYLKQCPCTLLLYGEVIDYFRHKRGNEIRDKGLGVNASHFKTLHTGINSKRGPTFALEGHIYLFTFLFKAWKEIHYFKLKWSRPQR